MEIPSQQRVRRKGGKGGDAVLIGDGGHGGNGGSGMTTGAAGKGGSCGSLLGVDGTSGLP